MNLTIYWQLDVAAEPGRGERSSRERYPSLGRDVRAPTQNRYDYYAQIARGAAHTAFDGLFLPHREESDDSQIVAAAITREVPGLALVPQFPASVGSAVYAAKQAVSFQRSTHERLGWAIAPDTDATGRARSADPVDEADLAARLEEFLTVARGVYYERPFSFAGRFFEVKEGGFEAPLSGVRFPPVFLEGEQEEALDASARLADVHLFRDGTLDLLRPRIDALDTLAKARGRSVATGLVQTVIAREQGDEAAGDAARQGIRGPAIVGDYDAVADALALRAAAGVSHLVLAATSSLEDVYRLGQHVLPRLRARLAVTRAAA